MKLVKYVLSWFFLEISTQVRRELAKSSEELRQASKEFLRTVELIAKTQRNEGTVSKSVSQLFERPVVSARFSFVGTLGVEGSALEREQTIVRTFDANNSFRNFCSRHRRAQQTATSAKERLIRSPL